MSLQVQVSPLIRLTYAFAGLLAGDAVLLILLFLSAIRVRALLLAQHVGAPGQQIPLALEVFVIYAGFSFAGWLIVGAPIVLFFPAHSITRLSWLLRLLVGAALGPLALSAVLILLAHGHLDFRHDFPAVGWLWAYSIVVSTVAFVVYVALLGKGMPIEDR